MPNFKEYRSRLKTPLLQVAFAIFLALIAGSVLAAESGPVAPKSEVSSSPEPTVLQPLLNEEWWALRVERVVEQIPLGRATEEDADALYAELQIVLTRWRNLLLRILNEADSPHQQLSDLVKFQVPPTAEEREIVQRAAHLAELEGFTLVMPKTVLELYDSVHSLYWSRVELLSVVSRELWIAVTGTYQTGVLELEGELKQFAARLELSELKIEVLLPEVLQFSKQVPLRVLGMLLKMLAMILLFVWWRRWAKEGLPKIQASLLELRPRRRVILKLVRAVWYIDRVRAPVEWMLLTIGLFSVLDVRGFGISIFYEFGRIFFKWIFVAWLIVTLINAIADRHSSRAAESTSKVRVRSTRLVAGWLVFTGLGLDLAANYTGKATLHEWVWLAFWVLLVPVAFLFLTWYRPEVQRQLEAEIQRPKWVEDVLATEKGFMSYRWALFGLGYLTALRIQRRFVSTIGELESGKKLLANFLYRETARQYDQTGYEEGEAVSDELRDTLLANEESIYEKYARQDLRELRDLIGERPRGVVLVTGERGSGKSLFVKRLVDRLEHNSVSIECPVGRGFEGYRTELLKALDLSDDQDSADDINRRLEERDIRAIVVDNVHRLARPSIGGQKEIRKLDHFVRQFERDVLQVLTLDKIAWQYMSRVHASSLFLEQIVVLPAWTEEQVAELIQMRTEAAGIEPDYGRFSLPPIFDERGLKTLEDRRRFGFYRILWSASDGNPEVALRLYVKSLAVLEDGRIIVKMPFPPDIEQLDSASINTLLVLRVIAQSGYSTPEEVSHCLSLPEVDVDMAFRTMRARGWIEPLDGYYRITWRWYRAVTRTLIRQNLIGR